MSFRATIVPDGETLEIDTVTNAMLNPPPVEFVIEAHPAIKRLNLPPIEAYGVHPTTGIVCDATCPFPENEGVGFAMVAYPRISLKPLKSPGILLIVRAWIAGFAISRAAGFRSIPITARDVRPVINNQLAFASSEFFGYAGSFFFGVLE